MKLCESDIIMLCNVMSVTRSIKMNIIKELRYKITMMWKQCDEKCNLSLKINVVLEVR